MKLTLPFLRFLASPMRKSINCIAERFMQCYVLIVASPFRSWPMRITLGDTTQRPSPRLTTWNVESVERWPSHPPPYTSISVISTRIGHIPASSAISFAQTKRRYAPMRITNTRPANRNSSSVKSATKSTQLSRIWRIIWGPTQAKGSSNVTTVTRRS